LAQRDGGSTILPVWHGVDYDFVRDHSLLLAGRVGVSFSKAKTIRDVADAIEQAVKSHPAPRPDLLATLPRLELDQQKFRSACAWWGAGDLPLRDETSLSQERLITLAAFVAGGIDDVSAKAEEELVNDRSNLAADALLYGALNGGWGSSGLLQFGVPAVPWILNFLLNGRLNNIRYFISEPGGYGEDTAREYGTLLRCIGAISDMGYLKQVKDRLRAALGAGPDLAAALRFIKAVNLRGRKTRTQADYQFYPKEIRQILPEAPLKEAIARWSCGDRPLALETALPAAVFKRLRQDIQSREVSDRALDSAFELASDPSVPSVIELFNSASANGLGASLLFLEYRIPALPWILALLLYSSRVPWEMFQSLFEIGITLDGFSLLFRFIAATKELGLWEEVESRCRAAGGVPDQTGFFLLADSIQFPVDPPASVAIVQ